MQELAAIRAVDRWGPLTLLIVPLLAIAVGLHFFGSTLIMRVGTTMFINLTLVAALQMFMGNSGILSFANIGFMGIGAYASAIFSMSPEAKLLGIPDLYPLLHDVQVPYLAAVCVGAGIAGITAAIVSYPLMRLSDAAAVITTFALLVVIHNVLVHWDSVTNGPQTLFGVPRKTTLWVSVLWGCLFVVAAYLFKESRLGLQLRASRDDHYAAAAVGVDIVYVRWVAFTLQAFTAGFAGGLWAHFITSFSPTAFYLKETFVILAMLVIGGPGSVAGAVVGTLVVTAAFEGLRGIENWLNIHRGIEIVGLTEVCLAVAMIVILILRPGGITAGRELRWPGKRTVFGAGIIGAAPGDTEGGETHV